MGLMGLHVSGYMIEVDYDSRVLTVHGTTGPARSALAGGYVVKDAQLESGATSVAEIKAATKEAFAKLERDGVTIRREDIASIDLKRANPLVNGNLVITTTDGRKYQLHYRRKHQADFDTLHAALLADAS